MISSGYAAQARLIAHVEQAEDRELGIFAITFLENIQDVLHQYVLRLKEVDELIESLHLAVAAYVATTLRSSQH